MTVRSLTQVEAEERAALIAVERYDITIDLTDLPTGSAVTCVSTVTFGCREPGASTFADCVAPIVSATLNGEPLPPAVGGRIPLTGLAEHNVLRVESVQADTTDGPGVHKAVDPADGEVYVWTTFCPDEARYVFACFDQPDLKAPHAFVVTAPTSWLVGSNSGTPAVEERDGARRWTFPDTPVLSTYNCVVNAGPLHEVRREAGGYDLGLFCRRSLAPMLDRDADRIFTVTEQGLAFFGDVFGRPFPQREYNQMFMPEFGGAMENWGCVTWEDRFLQRSEPTPAEQESLAVVLLHELSHMWFGNLVTMRWWDDLWLNEAFAEFACYWAAVGATRHTDAWVGLLASEKLVAYLADQGPVSHPIRQPVRDVAQAASIFDAITYPKGAAVLRQLMTYVGEDRFVAGMRSYFARHAWGSTTLQDLIDALAETSGRDLNTWRTGWLETAGVDTFTFEPGTLTGSGPAGLPRPQVLAIGSYVFDDGRLRRTALATVDVQGASTSVVMPEDADFYLVNDEDLTFATTRPSARDRATLVTAAGALPTPVSRGVAVATPDEALTCLTSVLTGETSDAVIEPYLRLAGNAAELWAGDDRLMTDFYALCARLAEQPGREQVALRGMIRSAPDLDAIDRLRDRAGDDIDLHWRCLIRAAELGQETDSPVRDLLARDPDPDATFRALAVRAARPDADEKAAVWQILTVDRSVPVSSMRDVTTAFWRPGQDAILSGYGDMYLRLLPTFDRGGMVPSMVYSSRLLPRFGTTADFPAQAERAVTDAAPVIRQTVLEYADELRRMIRARSGAAQPTPGPSRTTRAQP
ncbi:aminopeptidase [Paractinoplanes abujensis]|uniref:Aminopeptidase N n=1 Tax=Paractinoplanes abujensis TaxID=882441 RepID=A0A7W7CK57_9ACTN|nr:aminopeptidase N [Actinoplanes abujensis]MBB4690057.1 aminopeptidase N [Actinoplanes abujensis]GID20830.1 aminopeptidase [Actinoplanes abujensis]